MTCLQPRSRTRPRVVGDANRRVLAWFRNFYDAELAESPETVAGILDMPRTQVSAAIVDLAEQGLLSVDGPRIEAR